MNNLTKFYNNNIVENNENLYLYFKLGENKYGVKIQQVVEIMKLPLLEYPQRLANNAVGLLNYNNFTINVLDLRFYLNIKIEPYSVANQLLIVKTDESLFGLIINKVENIISLEPEKIEYLASIGEDKIIEFIYKNNADSISVINLLALENVLKQGVELSDINISELFPKDDDSKYELMQRKLFLQEKFNTNLAVNVFSHDKFISFSLSENIYCINLEYIKEFLKNISITKVPCGFDYIKGIVALRGDFVTIIDSKKFLGIEESADNYSEEISADINNIVIVEFSDYVIGFLVDEIHNIINIPEELIKPNPQLQNKYILSEVIIENKIYSILDIRNILSDEKFFIDDRI